jgi:hypothetical protein
MEQHGHLWDWSAPEARMIEQEIQNKLKALEADYFSELEIAVQQRKNPRTIARWFELGIGPPATVIQGRRYYHKRKYLQWLVDREKPARKAAKGGRR